MARVADGRVPGPGVPRACAPAAARLRVAATEAREQRRFEAICARELMGDIC
ncbi:hypothetical protein [Sphingomonas turrisvirgatae]|uniref:hypothetical protein n=1 Tax=Sphingomonas turrisvirgatae TaxID=1888892 RepID=UPI00156B6766|nr:hypothetical protein [Sphingomonas turrisvirgatae]